MRDGLEGLDFAPPERLTLKPFKFRGVLLVMRLRRRRRLEKTRRVSLYVMLLLLLVAQGCACAHGRGGLRGVRCPW